MSTLLDAPFSPELFTSNLFAILAPSVYWLPVFFRTLAAIVAAPIAFFTALDIAAYLIARSVGAPHHRHTPASRQITVPAIPANQSQHKPPTTITITAPISSVSNVSPNRQLPTPPSESPSPVTHFASFSESNLALAGEGLFSPPESRSSSPPARKQKGKDHRHRAGSLLKVDALGSITDSDAGGEETETEESSEGGSVLPSREKSYLGIPSPAATLRRRNPSLQFTPVA